MSDLDRLFYWRGIAPDFVNYRGELTAVPEEHRLKLVRAMGVDTNKTQEITQALYDLDVAPWTKSLSPLEIVPSIEPALLMNFSPSELAQAFQLEIHSETICTDSEAAALDDASKSVESEIKLDLNFTVQSLPECGDYQYGETRYTRRKLVLPSLKPGYYRIKLSSSSKQEEAEMAVVPQTAYLQSVAHVESVREKRSRPWGLIIQLYTLRSENNWGIGDFGDLSALIQLAAAQGADLIGLNPFHALQVDLKHNFSPYSPSDRRFLNPLYLDVPKVPGYVREDIDRSELKRLREASHLDYEAIRAFKYPCLFHCYIRSLGSQSHLEAFCSYLSQADSSLFPYLQYEAEHNWSPEDDVLASGAEAFLCIKSELAKYCGEALSETSLGLIGFYGFIQWQAELQLERCQAMAKSSGMSLGLIRDLAVGASRVGSEVLSNGSLFCKEASIGAPPDPLALTGQNWGIPPMDPVALKATGFKHFIRLLRSNMQHCAALRIDHAMSLLRLWWCPPGATADKGAYVYYDFNALSGLLCLESHLNRCEIIAEDLGIVPPEFKALVDRARLFGNRVFYFEKWADQQFKSPDQYDEHALAMVNNHDVPTLVSWWNATDLELRQQLDLLEPGSEMSVLLSARLEEKKNIVEQMRGLNVLPSEWFERPLSEPADEAIVFALIEYLSQTKSHYFVIQLEDLMLMDAPVNVPGTFDEYPNWTRKLEQNIESLFQRDSVVSLMAALTRARKK